LIKSLEEENRVNNYLIEEKLPKEIEARRKVVQQLQKLASVPAMDAKDLEELKSKMYQLNDEITELIERKNFDSNPVDDQLAVFRQQANIVNRKKEVTAEKVNDLRIEAQQSEEELKQKKDLMRDSEGNEYVTNVQFKNYVNKLRSKTNLYKKKRGEMQDLAAELGVLSRTQELLKQQDISWWNNGFHEVVVNLTLQLILFRQIEGTIGGNDEISSQQNM
uniref:Uncharacterized protein n=1 Tax=Romanomermis culicivorax TaxID=13658 RepID=A0A915IPL7_ROMCU